MQVAVISGKGGTGKTTIAVGIAETIKKSTKIDCDVDAANMFLYYRGKELISEDFYAGEIARINLDKCRRCGRCILNCKFDAIDDYIVADRKCEGCGVCKLVCPYDAVELVDNKVAKIKEYKLEESCFINADMEIGADGSGKLITALRNKMKNDNNIIIIDSSPGIGCPVVASITGVDICLIVTEPTLSGLTDLRRIVELISGFNLKSLICINKYDINTYITKKIKAYCNKYELDIIGLVPYDDTVIESINDLKPIVGYKDSNAGKVIKEMAQKIIRLYEEDFYENSNSD